MGAAVVAGRVAVVVVVAVVAGFAVVAVLIAAVVVGFGFADVVVSAVVAGGGAWVDFEDDPQPAVSNAIKPRSVATGRCTAAQGTRVGTDGRLESRQVPTLRYVVADVFTDRPLAGNQLAVFTDGREVDDETMQALARELNFSETVFVLPPAEGGHARIRIFTPTMELSFAGHPVLGSAFVLAAPLQLGEIRLETGAGVVPVVLEREGARISFGWMSQPIPRWEPFAAADELLALLGVDSSLPVELYHLGPKHVYVALGSEDEVAALDPDFGALARLTDAGVNCFAGSGTRWKTRMFAPVHGVPEDPATGSAAGPLAIHLVRHGRIGFGEEIEISQGVEIGRPSTLYARAFGEGDRIDRVEVGGSAVVVARGEFRLP